MVEQYQSTGQPAISVDTKKKEQIGDFKNGGREYPPRGKPEKVRTHDFLDPELGKVAPYGVCDLTANVGWVNVGIDHDTAEFAVESIRRWWLEMGQARYRRAQRLLIAADCGGSNGYWVRLWRLRLPTSCSLPFRSATSRSLPASGTRSSTACSATSPTTGAAARC